MKRYLSVFFIVLSAFTIIVGYRFEIRWNGIISWGLVCIFLLFAAYFTKNIPNKNKRGTD